MHRKYELCGKLFSERLVHWRRWRHEEKQDFSQAIAPQKRLEYEDIPGAASFASRANFLRAAGKKNLQGEEILVEPNGD